MDPRQLEAFARRLGENPNDTEALNAAYQHGQTDPRGYAVFLEKAGNTSKDPAYAAHWLTEAAAVWNVSLQDPHRAARTLMAAVDKDPTSTTAADRLVEMYSEKSDFRSIAALYDRRAKHLERQVQTHPELAEMLGQIYAQLGQLYQESLEQPDRAALAFQRAVKHNPSDAYSIYQARELLKAAGRLKEALPLYAAEQALLTGDPERQLALFQDEAVVATEVGDLERKLAALRGALDVDRADDPSLKQQFGATVLEVIQGGGSLDEADRDRASDLFTSLAETYDGEHGYAYATCALECRAGNDRAAQLAMYYGAPLDRQVATAPLIAAYLTATTTGLMAEEARQFLLDAVRKGADSRHLSAAVTGDDVPNHVRAEAGIEMARASVSQGQADDAARHYRAVLLADPASVEAISYLADRLRAKKQHAKLRDLLLTASDQELIATEEKQTWLREVTVLCEGPLRDQEGAIDASQRLLLLDATDTEAADHLEGMFERTERWGELADLIRSRADADDDFEQKHSRYRRVAAIHLEKRADPAAAAQALWVLAELQPEEDETAFEAVDLFLEAGQSGPAIELLSRLVQKVESGSVRVEYSRRLAELLEEVGHLAEAGGAYAEAGAGSEDPELWASAVRCFEAVGAWEQAARAVEEQRVVTEAQSERARLCARQAGFLERLGDLESVIRLLDESVRLDPTSDEIAERLVRVYETEERHQELVSILLARASAHPDGEVRMGLRKRAALLARDALGDVEGMRSALLDLLEDGEDSEALEILADESESSGDLTEAVEFLRRLAVLVDGDQRAAVSVRVAELLERDGDPQGALDQYLLVLSLEPQSVVALTATARLQDSLGEPKEATETYARLLPLVSGEAKLLAARKRADLLAGLDQESAAREAYELVLELDSDDFEVVEILRDLCESSGYWQGYVGYQQQLIEVEGDPEEGAKMALRLAAAYSEELSQPERAMEAVAPFAEDHDEACRDEYIRLGDSLGKKKEVAEALVEWLSLAPGGPSRNHGLLAAYERFVEVGESAQAIQVGLELVRLKDATVDLAESLERVATSAKHLEALKASFEVLARDLSGPSRAEELVRQAEVLCGAGMQAAIAVSHGEQAMTSIAPEDAGSLLARLAALEEASSAKIAVYERQVSRCKSQEDQMRALCRGARVASDLDQPAHVRRFFQVAISLVGAAEGLDDLRALVKQLDQEGNSQVLRRALAESLSQAGGEARDGGKSRAAFLSRAASLAYEDLGDVERALEWLGDALIAHVEQSDLDQLLALGDAEGILPRVDETLGRALEQVADGPLVRALLKTRYDLRRDRLGDEKGAADDLKRLYDLAPSDREIADRLERTYLDSEDNHGLARLYEDQILRCREKSLRLELARKVARIWQDVLDEPREAADAWRRVLRLDSKDDEAKQGLERAKQAMRRVTAAEIAKGEAETRAEVAEAQVREREELKRREQELQAKAEEIRLRHSQSPPSVYPDPEEASATADDSALPEGEAPVPPEAEQERSPAVDPGESDVAASALPEVEARGVEAKGEALETRLTPSPAAREESPAAQEPAKETVSRSLPPEETGDASDAPKARPRKKTATKKKTRKKAKTKTSEPPEVVSSQEAVGQGQNTPAVSEDSVEPDSVGPALPEQSLPEQPSLEQPSLEQAASEQPSPEAAAPEAAPPGADDDAGVEALPEDQKLAAPEDGSEEETAKLPAVAGVLDLPAPEVASAGGVEAHEATGGAEPAPETAEEEAETRPDGSVVAAQSEADATAAAVKETEAEPVELDLGEEIEEVELASAPEVSRRPPGPPPRRSGSPGAGSLGPGGSLPPPRPSGSVPPPPSRIPAPPIASKIPPPPGLVRPAGGPGLPPSRVPPPPPNLPPAASAPPGLRPPPTFVGSGRPPPPPPPGLKKGGTKKG